MQYLTRRVRLLVGLLAGIGLSPAVLAEGTNSGSVVTNSVSLSYEVNSVAQTGSASVDFTVDRKLNLQVVTQNSDWVTVLPGQTGTPGSVGALDYLVTNTSNDTVGVVVRLIDRAALAVTGFTAQVGSPSAFAPSPATGTMWNDENDNDLIDGAEASAALNATGVTSLNLGNMAEDATTNIKVVVNVGSSATGDQYRSFTLVAALANAGTALTGDNSGNAAPGGSSTDAANDINAVETVFADAGSANSEDIQFNFVAGSALASADAAQDGQSADTSGFVTVLTLSVAKHVQVLYDPISGNAYNGSGAASGANPKAIPGAVLMYVIGVVNNTGSLSAANVEIDDDIPDASSEVLEGDQANPSTAIDVPASVTFDVGGVSTSFTLDRAGVLSNPDQVWVQGCGAASATGQAFSAGDPEINNAAIGTCDAGESGYVVYLVTINDA
ncbi:MAG: hypothetical protein H6993_04225 [Pseudomonadales bacterium]|nr:hypothetical protein [Pseudomonadales bacterium]MCP5183143.1 hypothetical protein [Pseudomonadales bacterium]